MLETPPYVVSASSHSAALFRQTAQSLISGAGVVGSGDLAITQNGTPNMSVNVAAGVVWMPGTLGATGGMPSNLNSQGYGLPSGLTAQGSYAAYQDATVNLVIAAADPTNPRKDIVCASVQDAAYSGSNNQCVLQVVTGTPAPSPSAPNAPASSVVLAEIAVGAGVTSIVTANITDKRPYLRLNGYGDLGWSTPALLNAWTVYAGNTIGYIRSGNLVTVKGIATGGTIGAAVFNLPVGYRPSYSPNLATVSNGALGYMYVTTGGDVVASTGSNAWFSIACTFSVV